MAYDDRETGLTVEDRGSKLGLPQNQDAEANVLAAMLLSPEVVEEAQVELQPDDFYRPIHKTIYTAMVDMYNSRIPIDSISLIDYLRSINKLDAVGGEAYILELMGQTLSLVNWQHHAAIVRRDSMLRELIGATNEINALAYNAPTDTKEVVELAESKLLKVTAREVKSSYKTLTEFMVEAYNEAEEVCQAGGQAAGVPTGFPSLDRMLMGFREGQLIIIGARPAVGKTSGCRPVARGRIPLSGRSSTVSWTRLLPPRATSSRRSGTSASTSSPTTPFCTPLSTSRPFPLPGTIRRPRPTARPSMASRASARRACPSGASRPSRPKTRLSHMWGVGRKATSS